MLKLVYGCLAFTLIAGVLLAVAASRQEVGFRGTTKAMADAATLDATVLDADAGGAITEAGNGRVTGYRRGGGALWSIKFDRFKAGPNNPDGAGSIDAAAWCAGSCPRALVEFDGQFSTFGGVSDALAGALTDMRQDAADVFAVADDDAAFVRSGATDATQRRLLVIDGAGTTAAGIVNPSEVQPERPHNAALVGSPRENRGILNIFTRHGQSWRRTGRALSVQELKNICISDDEGWIGAVSTRVRRFAVGGRPGAALGPAISGGTCSVDAQGITAIYTPASNPESLSAARHAADGRRSWAYTFGAQRPLSPAGSPYLVAQAPGGIVIAIDARTGRVVFRRRVSGEPFVAADGSIVTADRKGQPKWLFSPAARAR